MPGSRFDGALRPPFVRRMIFAYDPAAPLDLQTAVVNVATVTLPWEMPHPGPVGAYIE